MQSYNQARQTKSEKGTCAHLKWLNISLAPQKLSMNWIIKTSIKADEFYEQG